jgi:ATP-dependent RNA helicase RhlE
MLVLDEADRMLDMGFIHDVKKILAGAQRKAEPAVLGHLQRRNSRLANGLLNSPKSIQVTPRNTTVQRIKQTIHPVGRGKKKALLVHIIQQHNWSQVLVFTRTKFGANNVAEFLTKNGIRPWRCTATRARAPAPRRWPASRAVTSAPWWPPTLRPAASTSTTCRTW